VFGKLGFIDDVAGGSLDAKDLLFELVVDVRCKGQQTHLLDRATTYITEILPGAAPTRPADISIEHRRNLHKI
jgi:hypothetical protein